LVTYTFGFSKDYVKHIQFKSLTNSGEITAKVEILKSTSSLVTKAPPDIVYKNLNVWVGNLGWFTEKNVADPVITFSVEKSWAENNNINLNSISLYNFNENTWKKISTEKIDGNSTMLYFKASLPVGPLGPMSISGQPVEALPGGQPPDDVKAETPKMTYVPYVQIAAPTSVPTHAILPVDTPVTWTSTWEQNVPGFQILSCLSAIAIIALLLCGRRRE
jgi:PGF-pre-PGF domain-containing protein